MENERPEGLQQETKLGKKLDWQALVEEAVHVRKRERLTQHDLAALAGVSQPTIWKFEKGDTHIRLDSALGILDALGLLARPQPSATRME